MRGGDGGLCETHNWGREILKLGHDVRLVPPIYVKPFVKRQQNDAADAEAICEAAQRPTMRFVAVKGEEQQARAMLFHTRDILVRQRTQTINALRGHLAEFGVVAPQGVAHVGRLASALEDPGSGLPGADRALGIRRAWRRGSVSLIQQAARFDGLQGVTVIGGGAALVTEVLALPESEGVYFMSPDLGDNTNVNQATGRSAADVLTEFEATYGGPPSSRYWAHGYDAATLLLAAIKQVAVVDGDALSSTVRRSAMRWMTPRTSRASSARLPAMSSGTAVRVAAWYICTWIPASQTLHSCPLCTRGV